MKILSIFAHPDDEIIWGWPIMQDKSIERHLLIVSDNHTSRKDRALKALEEVCDSEGIRLLNCLCLESEFYRRPTRFTEHTLMHAVNFIKSNIPKGYDYYFTHNPNGEYGHGDHILTFRIVAELCTNVIYGDAFNSNCHYSYKPRYIKEATGRTYQLDKDFLNRTKAIYQKHQAWSWSFSVPETIILKELMNFENSKTINYF